jgi:hypothetical protein
MKSDAVATIIKREYPLFVPAKQPRTIGPMYCHHLLFLPHTQHRAPFPAVVGSAIETASPGPGGKRNAMQKRRTIIRQLRIKLFDGQAYYVLLAGEDACL